METWAEITLDEIELSVAMHAGIQLHHLSQHLGLKDRPIAPGVNPIYLNQVGMLGEMVVAKYLDLYWGGSARSYGKADLSHRIEVRTITRPDNGLKVRERDKGKRVVGVLLPASLSSRVFQIVGWLEAEEGMKQEWVRDPYNAGRPYYAVPLLSLHPISMLKELISHVSTN
jgi:hypothetical protein